MFHQILCIETERLTLLALSINQLEIYGSDMDVLGRQLEIPMLGDHRPIKTLHAVDLILDKMCSAPPADHPWQTYWLIIPKAEPAGAGVIGFIAPPDKYGKVVIGYGIDPAYQNRGYMTEAVKALVAWAFQNPACKTIVAEVMKNNIPSIRVLEKVGARRVKTDNSMYCYHIVRREKTFRG
jgi:[ribosomal protein S5]-alanine N-acetyltransferase